MTHASELYDPEKTVLFNEDVYDEFRMNWLYAAIKKPKFKEYTDAREVGDDSACTRMEADNIYLSELYDDLGPCEYAEYQHYESLLVYWFDCFKKNETYAKYCQARHDEREAEVESMETTWPKLRQLYSDWKDIHATELSPKEWVRENQHLFYTADFIAVAYGEAASGLKGSFKAEIVDNRLKQMEKDVKNGQGPKYPLTQFPGETWSQMSQRVSMDWYVYDIRSEQEVTLKDMTRLFHFESDIFRGMGKGQARHLDGSPMTAEEFKNKRKGIKKMQETYQCCIEGTIKGTFPTKYFKDE
ncbi:hypothetical protein ACO0K0_16230 [Undibacterium sp. SXout11W]|uniref:hypothetical protein n=1 Tax=Undibacterium sp. SXout11W TaxID=3413050 RepID=UPI003BF20CD1